jgi:hypothetical protein
MRRGGEGPLATPRRPGQAPLGFSLACCLLSAEREPRHRIFNCNSIRVGGRPCPPESSVLPCAELRLRVGQKEAVKGQQFLEFVICAAKARRTSVEVTDHIADDDVLLKSKRSAARDSHTVACKVMECARAGAAPSLLGRAGVTCAVALRTHNPQTHAMPMVQLAGSHSIVCQRLQRAFAAYLRAGRR